MGSVCLRPRHSTFANILAATDKVDRIYAHKPINIPSLMARKMRSGF